MIKIKDSDKGWSIPFIRKDGIRTYLDHPSARWATVFYEPNFIFEATLVPTSCARGRTSMTFTMQDVDSGCEFPLKMKSAFHLLQAVLKGGVKIKDGGFAGTYTFTKQGTNYSIQVCS